MSKILSFRMGQNLYGLETNQVTEINRNPEITEIPLAPEKIAGVMNLRGQVVSLLDFAKCLGYSAESPGGTCIVLKKEKGETDLFALLVERAEDVIEIAEEMCEDPPPHLRREFGEKIERIAKLERELVMIIDRNKLFRD